MLSTKIIITILFTLFVSFFFVFGAKKNKGDLLSPCCFVNLYFYITRIPRLLIAHTNLYQRGMITDLMLWKYFSITLLFLFVFNVTVLAFQKKHSTRFLTDNIKKKLNFSNLFLAAIVTFLLGAVSRVYQIHQAGGIIYVWSNLWNRTTLLSGTGYIDYLTILMTFGVCCLEICVLNNKDLFKYKFFFIVFLLFGSLLYLSFGARSSFVKMLFGLFFSYYYFSPKKVRIRDFLKLRYLLVAIVVIVILIILPTLRTTNFSLDQLTPELILARISDDDSSIINEISFFDEDVFTFEYFGYHNHWYGANYLNLLTAWIPRSIYPNKGIIDDGMYLRAIMKGFNDIYPTMSLEQLDAIGVSSSVPFTTNGIFYANFGIIGTIGGGFLTGLILTKSYNQLSKHISLDNVLFYQFLCIRLCLSVKGIVELLMTFLIIKVICKFVFEKRCYKTSEYCYAREK